MLYTLADIEAHFAPDSLEQGWQSIADGVMSAPNIQRGGEIVTGILPQRDGRSLRVYVRTLRTGETLTINGECSCGKKHNCEHVAAVLLRALQDGQTPPEPDDRAPPVLSNRPDKTLGRAVSQTSGRAQTLLYLLRIDEQGVLVEPNVAHRRERGSYSVGQPFDPGKAARGIPPRFLQPVDLELLTALDRLPRAPELGLPMIGKRGSDDLLRALLATGRSHRRDRNLLIPLRLGPARPIACRWLTGDDAVQRIDAQTTPAADRLLLLNRPWYLDSAAGECGPVKSDLLADAVNALLCLPPVAPEQVENVCKALAKAYPGQPIPQPQAFDVQTMPRVRPTPCLHMTSQAVSGHSGACEFNDFARLCFDYGGIEVDPEGPDTRLVEGRAVRLQRDRQAEQVTLKQLYELGLQRYEHAGADAVRFTAGTYLSFADADSWLDFQAKHLPALRRQGWQIIFKDFRYRLREPTQWTCKIERLEQDDWFGVDLGVEVDGQRVDLLPILLDALRTFPLGLSTQADLPIEYLIVPFTDEQGQKHLLRLPAERLSPLLRTLLELYDQTDLGDMDRLRVERVQLARLSALDPAELEETAPALQWLGDDDAQQLVQGLRGRNDIAQVLAPAGLLAELRPYQRQGLSWLQFLREYRMAGILADDMGLGKTLQVLAHLLVEKASGRADLPSLVIAPTSLMFNWHQEVKRFTPGLKIRVLHGPHRRAHHASIAEHDLVLTTYPLLVRDKQALLAQTYHLLVLDEAQVIKNPEAQASRAAREIKARHRLCLTGTPMENHLGELWSLFDFLLPGLLGDNQQFRRFFRTPIEKHGSEAAAQRLSRRIRPFLLRRTKQLVAAELPAKSEIRHSVVLQGKQRELYETVRLAMHRRVRDEIERLGVARSHIVVLDALLKLRQVCCDPRLLKGENTSAAGGSAKLDMLMQLLPEMVEQGRRILVFSQFTTMLALIENEVVRAGIDYSKLTGRTRDRRSLVQRFQQGAVPLFLISLKAGGVGLNLTAADTVIHYDPWWNPAVENQATDRAHRIGQRRAVFVYKLLCEGTVEEKIQAMQQRKRDLADRLYAGGGDQGPQWRREDLDELFAPLHDISDGP